MLYSGYILWKNISAFTKAALLMDVPDHHGCQQERETGTTLIQHGQMEELYTDLQAQGNMITSLPKKDTDRKTCCQTWLIVLCVYLILGPH